MAEDIGRYGGGESGGDFYWIREVSHLAGNFNAILVYIDGLGKVQRVAVAKPGMFTPDEIEALPNLGEAIAFHLSPSFDRAEKNRKAWLRNRPEPEQRPKAPAVDAATRRFFEGG